MNKKVTLLKVLSLWWIILSGEVLFLCIIVSNLGFGLEDFLVLKGFEGFFGGKNFVQR